MWFPGTIKTALPGMDREVKENYQVVIQAKDMAGQMGGLSGTTTVSITLSDVNDSPPRFANRKLQFLCLVLLTHHFTGGNMSALKCLHPTLPTPMFRFFPRDISGVRRGWRRHWSNQGGGPRRRTQCRDGVQHCWRSRHVQHRHGPNHTGGSHRNQKGFCHFCAFCTECWKL